MTVQALSAVTPGTLTFEDDSPPVAMDDVAIAERYYNDHPELKSIYGGEDALSDDTDALSEFGIH